MIQTVDFDDYAGERVGREGRVPLSGSLELTARCNLRCLHCYMLPYRPAPELATGEVLRLLDELADAGCLRLLLTGGEPLTRPDFRTIWGHAKSRGFLLTLFTNATLVDAETAAFLRDLPPTMCEVSLYGASSQTYRRVCGDASAFDAAVAGLDRLLGAVPHVGAKGMALRENGDDMAALAALCSERGLEFSFDTDIFPRLDGDRAPLAHAYETEEGVRRVMGSRLHREVWGRMGEAWREATEAGGRRDAGTTSEESRRDASTIRPLKREGKVVVCRAGESSFHIGPYGDLCLCMLLREPHYDLRHGMFREGWRTVIAGLLERERSTPADCARCPDLTYCVPCAGRNYLETGSAEEAAPLVCRRSRAVREAFGGLADPVASVPEEVCHV